MNRRRLLGLALSAGAGAGALSALGAHRGLGKSVLALVCPSGGDPYRRTIACMGTYVSISVHDARPERHAAAVGEAFDEVRAIDSLMSIFRPESQVSALNAVAGHESIAIDPRLAEVLRAARRASEDSDGAFDVTVLPVLRAFGFARGRHRLAETSLPEAEALASALARVDFRALEIDRLCPMAGLTVAGAGIDLGGIAKGYAVDRAAEVLRERGVRRAVINAGGDLRALGAPADAAGWRVGIQHPLHPGQILATLELRDQAIATSGNTEQFIEVGGERLGHLIDPESGSPAESMLSASVVAPTAMLADAASTTAFLKAGGSDLSGMFEGTSVDHVFVDRAPGGVRGKRTEGDSDLSTTELTVRASPGITRLAMSAMS